MRVETRSLRQAPFVDVARLLGAGPLSIARRHRVPNRLPLVWPQLPLIYASALLIEAGPCFRGAGDPNRLRWGILIQTGQANALRGWWLACFPGMVLALATVGLALLAPTLFAAMPADNLVIASPAAVHVRRSAESTHGQHEEAL